MCGLDDETARAFRRSFLRDMPYPASMAFVQSETALLFWWLNILHKRRYDALVGRFGSLDSALGHVSPALFRELGMKDDTIRNVFVKLEDFDPVVELARLQRADVSLLSIEDDAYPRLLRESSDPPVFLSYRGDLSVLDHPCVAVVGTREMTPYGERVAEWISPALARAGCTTVSGLAFGIDAVVAQETIDAGGRTVAVLGSGIGTIAPKTNARLADAIVANGGLVVSEYPYTEGAQPFMFPARNRIVAGLSLATVVVEAPAQSGALITARLALEENRDVFACPGPLFDPAYEGNHRLIAEGQAQLLRSPDDVLRAIGVVVPASSAPSAYEPASPDEAAVLSRLTTLPTSIDDLVVHTGKSAGELAGILTMLELAGAVAKANAGWVRA